MLNGVSEKLPLVRYFSEVRTQLREVSWPNRQETVSMTALVIASSFIVAIYLGSLDFLFTQLVTFIVR